MKKLTLILMIGSLLVLGGQSFAEMCTIDAVPAATLLLPNFKVDIGDADGDGNPDCATQDGVTTLFSVNNASAAPTVAHVTLWTDWSLPVVDFDIFLTGYDVQTVDLCNVIGRGSVPVTADDQNDPDDEISPHGTPNWSNPDWDGDIANCEDFFPFPDPVITGGLLDRVQNSLSGYEVAEGGCRGNENNGAGECDDGLCPGGTIATGYATIDNVNQCNTFFPNETGYFQAGGTGIASNVNQLWGDYFLVDPVNDFAQGDNLVHIEADSNFDSSSTPTGYTFYGRYLEATGFGAGDDNREPLGTTWGARYLNGGAFDGGTSFTVWRDSTDNLAPADTNDTFDCGECGEDAGAGPEWCPLNETQVVCWDEQEHPVELCFIFGGGVISPPEDPTDPTCFPLETQMTQVGVGDLDPPDPFGWCFLNLNHTCTTCVPGGFGPDGDIAQSWVGTSHNALGRFSVGYPAIELTNACQNLNPMITGNLGN